MFVQHCPIHKTRSCCHNVLAAAGKGPNTLPQRGHVFIYKITHVESGLVYVGYTSRSLEQRWMNHRSDAKRKPDPLYQAMRASGLHKFLMEELEECGEAIKRERELDYIWQFQSWKPENGYSTPDAVPMYFRKLFFLFFPAAETRYEALWEYRRSIAGGWRDSTPLPAGEEWVDKELAEVDELAQDIGRKLLGRVPSLATPVVYLRGY